MKLYALMGICRDYFWKGESSDPNYPDRLRLVVACLQVVEERVKNVKLAQQLIEELEKQKFPVVDVEAPRIGWISLQ